MRAFEGEEEEISSWTADPSGDMNKRFFFLPAAAAALVAALAAATL